MTAPVLRPLGIGEILDVSLKLAARNFGTLVRIVLFVVAPAQLLIALVDISAFPNYRPGNTFLSDTNVTQNTAPTVSWTPVAAALIALLVGFLASELAVGGCFRAIAERYLGLEASWRTSLAFARRHLRSILWITVLADVLVLLGMIGLLIPGVYLLVSFTVALPVLMAEGQRGRRALGRSRELVAGLWWRTCGLLVVAALLVSVVSGVISGLIPDLVLVNVQDPLAFVLITAVAGTVAAAITTPFVAAYHTVLYFDLRVRKEAFDLRLLASSIGLDVPEGYLPAEPASGSATGARPPFWPPPPPGWKPPDSDGELSPAPAQGPPSWPPPGGLTSPPGDARDEPPFWPPPPGWKPGAT